MSAVQSDVAHDIPDTDGKARRLVIVGGGIAGLSAAWYAQQAAAQRGITLHTTILEAAGRWGGKVLTEQIDGPGGGYLLEAGADALLTHKPWAVALARELGVDAQLVGGQEANSRTFVLHRNRLQPLPKGLQLLAPTQVWPFARSPLFSLSGKVRIGLEALIPPRRDTGDESLADFVRRRFGREALETLAEPLMADVYSMDSSRQSIQATFPQFPTLEAQYGSVIRGVRGAARQARQRTAAPSSAPTLPFVSFDQGIQTLVDALVSRLSLTTTLRLHSAVDRVVRLPAGSYRVLLADGTHVEADTVIVATPARAAADFLREAAPVAAAHLSAIRYASIGNAYLAYRRSDVSHPLNGYGAVIPRREGRRIDGMSWTSSKWAGRAPAHHVLLRIFFGGPHTRALAAVADEELLAIVREEVTALLGVQASPLFQRVYRWSDGYPQYEIGHLARVSAIEAALPAGLSVTGSAYRGIGVPDCIRQGQEAAQRAMTALAAAMRAEAPEGKHTV